MLIFFVYAGVCFEREAKSENDGKDEGTGVELGVVRDLLVQRSLVLIINMSERICMLCLMVFFAEMLELSRRGGGWLGTH